MSQTLFNEFHEVSAKEWKQKIQFDLKGADYNETLIFHSKDGISVKPFYNAEDLKDPIAITNPISWNVCEKIYVHADSDERLIRRLKRDINDRGRDLDEVLWRYQTTLKPMHQQFIEPTKEFADIIIPTNRYNNVAVDIVQTIIKDRLA